MVWLICPRCKTAHRIDSPSDVVICDECSTILTTQTAEMVYD